MKSVLCVLLFCAIGCTNGIGNGAVSSELREVQPFSKIAIQAGLRARLAIGPRALVVKTDENLHRLIETEVSDGVLTVRRRRHSGFSPSFFEATICAPSLEAIEATAGARVWGEVRSEANLEVSARSGTDVTLTGFEADQLWASASGGSRVLVIGSASEQTVLASGGSRIAIEGAPADQVTIDFSGGSTGRVRAARFVRGVLSEGSHLSVLGAPAERDVSVSGGSSVTF